MGCRRSDIRHPPSASMQPELAVDSADFGWLDQLGMRHCDRVEGALQLLQPEIQKLVELGEPRTEVVILPDVGLQNVPIVRQAIQDMGRRQAIAFELTAKVMRNTATFCS